MNPSQHSIAVSHRGDTVVFALIADANGRPVPSFNILRPKADGTDEGMLWSGFSPLTFPSEVMPAGMSLVRVPRAVPVEGLFQAVSDQQSIYLFWASGRGIYGSRFRVVEIPSTQVKGDSRPVLEPAWEVRYQISASPDLPETDKDQLSPRNPEGQPFIEPIHELPVDLADADLAKASFSILLEPTAEEGQLRWQVFIPQVTSGTIAAYSFARSEDGWFVIPRERIARIGGTVQPDAVVGLDLPEGGDAVVPLPIVGPLAAVNYLKQEAVLTSERDVVKMKRNNRVLLLAPVELAGKTVLASLDFAVATDGTLSGLAKSRRYEVGRVSPAPSALKFDGVSAAVIPVGATPLILAQAFTLECWVFVTAADQRLQALVGGDGGPESPSHPPTLWIHNGLRIGCSFGTGAGTPPCAVLTRDNVLSENAWTHVAVTNGATGMVVYINGDAVPLAEPSPSGTPVATALTLVGATGRGQTIQVRGQALVQAVGTDHGFAGLLDELRVWSVTLDQVQIRRFLYNVIPAPQAKEDANLVGYWRMDEGSGTEVTDFSQYDRKLTLYGPAWTPTTAPLGGSDGTAVDIDARGLSTYLGVLAPSDAHPDFGAIAPGTRPGLLFSADGLVHLYYQGARAGLLLGCQYDPTIDRAAFGFSWRAGAVTDAASETGFLTCAARQSGTAVNKAVLTATALDHPLLCEFKLSDGLGVSETWFGLPRTVGTLVSVLGGAATDDPAIAQASGRLYFNRSGNRPAVLVQGEGTSLPSLWFASARIGAFALAHLEFKSTDDLHGDLAVTITTSQKDERLTTTVRGVPRETTRFLATLAGANGDFPYAADLHPGGPGIYAIAADPQAIAILIPPASLVTKAVFTVSKRDDPATCALTIELHQGETILHAAWPDLRRSTDAFIAGILFGTTPEQQAVATLLRFLPPGTAGQVQDSATDIQASIIAVLALVQAVNQGMSGNMPDFAAEARILQKATSQPPADLSRGSTLFVPAMAGMPVNGYLPLVDFSAGPSQTASTLRAGRNGGWMPEPPQYALRMQDEGCLVARVDEARIEALALSERLTIEGWAQFRPGPGQQSEFFPRLVHAQLSAPGRDSRYFLGLTASQALQVVGDSVITTSDGGVPADAGNLRLFPGAVSTVQLYLNPLLSTIGKENTIFRRESEGEAGKKQTETLVVNAGGQLTYRIQPPEGQAVSISAGTLEDAVWQQVSVVRTSPGCVIYRNGIEVGRQLDIAGFAALKSALTVAGNASGGALQMRVTAFSVWQRALTTDEILAGLFRPIRAGSTGLQLLWSLDGGTAGPSLLALNGAVATQGYYDTQVGGSHAFWTVPGLFSRAFFAVRNLAVQTRAAVAGASQWHHFAGVYQGRYGIACLGRNWADCGNDDSFNARNELAIEAWLTPGAATGQRQALVSKFADAAEGRSYELGLDGTNRPYLAIRLDGQQTPGGGAVLERLRVVTTTSPVSLSAALSRYVVGTAQIHSIQDFASRSMCYSLLAQVYVDGVPTIDGPAKAAPITDSTVQTYLLQVIGGSGSGRYRAGEKVTIVASSPALFQAWRGETSILTGDEANKKVIPVVANPSQAISTVQMPAADITISAVAGFSAISFSVSSTAVTLGRATRAGREGTAAFLGQLADIRIWRTALAPGIVAHSFATRTTPPAADNLISSYDFAEQQGTVAHDGHATNAAALSDSRMWTTFQDSAALNILVDGEPIPVETVPVARFGAYGNRQFRVGANWDEQDQFRNPMLGDIDEIRIWSDVRTVIQIRENMNRYLQGDEPRLAGYWSFNNGAGSTLVDGTGRGNDLRFEHSKPDAMPEWVPSTAPISNEAPPVRNVFTRRITAEVARISEGPAAFEYAALEYDSRGTLYSVVKRGYCYRTAQGSHLDTGYLVGSVDLVYIGQVQTKPTLIGFIEGAAPVPSENLTQPYYLNPVQSYFQYDGISGVTLTQSEGSAARISASREDSRGIESSFSAGVAGDNAFYAGVCFVAVSMVQIVKWQAKGGIGTSVSWSDAASGGTAISGEITRTKTLQVSSSGDWEDPDQILLASQERRYVPSNDGCALVKSATADVYGQILRSTGALMGMTVIPNKDIPEDVNLIYFPINPRYVRNGSLDGRIGLQEDPECAGQPSYFRPKEAYELQRRIERQTAQLAAWYGQVDAAARGKAQNASLGDVTKADPLHDWDNGTPRKDMMNKYVWTAGGGLYTEQEGYVSERQETFGGAFDFTWRLGGSGSLEVEAGPVGLFFELDVMGGQGWKVTVEKEKSEKSAIDLAVALDPESSLLKFRGVDAKPPYSRLPVPGKVETYRFATFYLAPKRENTAAFFTDVVDPLWLASSSEPRAAALREAQVASQGKSSWRVLHRVTYVSRIAPQFQAVPVQDDQRPVPEPANQEANELMLGLVEKYVFPITAPTPVDIAKAIGLVYTEDLPVMIPWWREFATAAAIPNSPAAATMRSLTQNTTEYVRQYYAAKASV